MNTASPIIIGIDPGYDRVGWAVGRVVNYQFQCIQLSCIQTKKTDSIFARYQQLQQELHVIFEQYKPTQAAIETLFFSKNKTTALRVSEARGVIIASALSHGCSIHEYTPVAIKQAVTGSGNANKEAVAKMVSMQISHSLKNHLDDAIDAVATAITHSCTHTY